MKNVKNRILENPTNFAIVLISLIAFVIGIYAIGFWISLLIVGIIDILCFFKPIKKKALELFQIIKKKVNKNKKKTNTTNEKKKTIPETKKEKKIVSNIKDEEMKKKKSSKASSSVKEKRGAKHILLRIFQWFLLFCCFCFIAGVIALGYFAYYIVENAPEFEPENLYSTEPTILYYADGSEMATIGLQKRSILTYDELPEVLINALVATEDANFFQHNGVDIKRFMVASVKQLLGNSNAGGASTLTMQLSKNYIVQDTTASGWAGIVRKFTDVYMSVFKIETTYTKEEILEFYINAGQLGSAYGVEAAAQTYFNKSASDINISEAAVLVGMFQAPSALNPFYYPEASERRRKEVLYLMHRHGYITDEEYDIAIKMTVDKIVVGDENNSQSSDDVPPEVVSAVDTVVAEVQDKTGVNPRTTSMKIYTTFDKKQQKHVGETMIGKNKNYKWENGKVQAGVAVIDVNTGAITAIGGNRDVSGSGNFNHATDINYQIGSTSKPLYDYAPAIEYLNWSTATIVADEKDIAYSDGTKINNWDGKYKGFISIREGLKLSRNIPALKTFRSLEPDVIEKFVKSLGLNPEEYLHEAHSIGGYNGESPLSMAAAYAAFANGGYYTEPYSFTKLVYSNTGETYINQTKTNQVMHDYTAYMITSILQDAASYGLDSGKYYNINGVKYAAKTGTTNYDKKQIKEHKLPSKAVNDYWIVGYNTDYAIGIWYGYDSIKDGTNTLGSTQHARIFNAIGKGIFKKGTDDWKMPSSVVKVTVEKDSATLMLPSEFTPKKYKTTELFVKGTEPKNKSTRFAKLDSITNLQGYSSLGTIHLSWDPIETPDAFDEEYLKGINKNAYEQEKQLEAYVKSLITTNTKVLGTVGYNIYVKNADGTETFVAWTDTPSYALTGYSGNVEVVVKTSYSVFKDNEADGKTITVYNQSLIPEITPPENPEVVQ